MVDFHVLVQLLLYSYANMIRSNVMRLTSLYRHLSTEILYQFPISTYGLYLLNNLGLCTKQDVHPLYSYEHTCTVLDCTALCFWPFILFIFWLPLLTLAIRHSVTK